MTSKKLIVAGLTAIIFSSCQMKAQSSDNKRERKEPPTVDQIFEHMDENDDELLSKEEVKGPLRDMFSKIDTDEDGFLSKDEVEKAPRPKRKEKPNRN